MTYFFPDLDICKKQWFSVVQHTIIIHLLQLIIIWEEKGKIEKVLTVAGKGIHDLIYDILLEL